MSRDWPHQVRGLQLIDEALGRVDAVGFGAPTGSGKSRVMQRIIERGQDTVLYANRRMLIEQLSAGLDAAGIDHGIHMSGYGRTVWQNVQIASIQSAYHWWKSNQAELPAAELVLVDEIHNTKGESTRELLEEHKSRGAKVVAFSATPVGLRGIVDELIVGAVNSELRKCGALVPAVTYAPDEPDMKAFRSKTPGILQFRDDVKEVMLPAIFGSVVEHYLRYNPDGRPAILFAPGVEESLWFAEHLCDAGVPAAHIDGGRVWINGETLPSDRETRERLAKDSRTGVVRVVCNRFVLREGIDWPWLYHAIFACTFGGICSYIQSGGRVLRAHPSMDHVIIQDHGGNFWRHDSLNCDRNWTLDTTEQQIARDYGEACRAKPDAEPVVCPKCKAVRRGGPSCPKCGHTYSGKQRMVVQLDGSLKPVRGDIYKPRQVSTAPEDHKLWERCYWRSLKSGMTFNQAVTLFQRENNYKVPASDFPLMPTVDSDWARKVADVPRDRLTRKPQPQPIKD